MTSAELQIPRELGDALHDAAISTANTLRKEVEIRKVRGTLTEADDKTGEAEWMRVRELRGDLESQGCWSPLLATRDRPEAGEPTFGGGPVPTGPVTVVEDREWLARMVLRALGGCAYLTSGLIAHGQSGVQSGEWPLGEIKTYLLVLRRFEELLDLLGWPEDISAEPEYPWPKTFYDQSKPGPWA